MKKELTLKQQLFAAAWLGEARGNGTEAARLAKYKGNDNTLHAVGVENLRKPTIIAYIAKAREKLAKRNEITQDSVLKDLEDDRELAYRHGQASAAISATKLRGGHIGMFGDKLNVQHEISLDDCLDKILARLRG